MKKSLNQIQIIISTKDDDFKKIREKILKIKGVGDVWLNRWIYLNGK